ncbi:MurR/RpiR family transcriptional regulator [Agrilactobacillus fermenti]|uniref:MurR/RpiR family transcriptional regulator n=1 Tax=Agrilactobacillus fermenti TaxID=2586909 RepID=UPI001E3E937C|nr:MurR/RpiR family transcriptional regulator [Agrilactobacillus fermenti]MCD2257315.1 MurR/RpiR family transcriptional regulator [Agrilactobacillus fermenti]
MKSVLYQIRQDMASYTKSEQKVATYILHQPERVIHMSAEELAQAAKSSAASVTRFAKLICEEGLPGLKIRLSAEQSMDTDLYDEVAPDDDLNTLKKKMLFRTSQALHATNDDLSSEAIAQAVGLLQTHQQINIFGIGASALVAGDLVQKLLRIGKSAFQTTDVHLFSSSLQSVSLLVLISNSGETAEALKLAALAKTKQIPILAIVGDTLSTLAQQGDVVLTHDHSGEGLALRTAATTSLIAQLYVVDILYYCLLQTDFEHYLQMIRDSRQTIKQFFD